MGGWRGGRSGKGLRPPYTQFRAGEATKSSCIELSYFQNSNNRYKTLNNRLSASNYFTSIYCKTHKFNALIPQILFIYVPACTLIIGKRAHT